MARCSGSFCRQQDTKSRNSRENFSVVAPTPAEAALSGARDDADEQDGERRNDADIGKRAVGWIIASEPGA